MTQTSTFAIKDPQSPASEKQVHFLYTVLLAERDCPQVAERANFAKALGFLSKGDASALISEAMKAPKKTGQTNTVQDWAKAKAVEPEPIAAPALTELPAFGYYQLNGTLYYWDVTGKDLYPQLRKLVMVPIYGGGQKGSWKKVYAPYGSVHKVTATWIPLGGKGYNKAPVTKPVSVPQVLAEAVLVANAQPMSQDEAGKLGKQFGFCIRCGATLTDPVSVANGIGPVCATYWH